MRLSAHAEPQAEEEKKQRILMFGVRDNIFSCLARSPKTADEEFVTEASYMEYALQARISHY